MYHDGNSPSLGNQLIMTIPRKVMSASIGPIAMVWLLSQSGIPRGTEIRMILFPEATMQARLTHTLGGIMTSTGTPMP